MKKLFLILGKSGSGKTTIADFIIKKNKNIEHYSMGNEFRKIAKQNSKIGKYVFSGKRVPDNIASEVLLKVIHNFTKEIIILDGFPRDYKQTNLLNLLLKNNNIHLEKVFEISLDDDIAKSRVLNRKRGTDDNVKVFNSRLEDYNIQMKQIRMNYSKILINIDGDDKVENIANKISKYITYKNYKFNL